MKTIYYNHCSTCGRFFGSFRRGITVCQRDDCQRDLAENTYAANVGRLLDCRICYRPFIPVHDRYACRWCRRNWHAFSAENKSVLGPILTNDLVRYILDFV